VGWRIAYIVIVGGVVLIPPLYFTQYLFPQCKIDDNDVMCFVRYVTVTVLWVALVKSLSTVLGVQV